MPWCGDARPRDSRRHRGRRRASASATGSPRAELPALETGRADLIVPGTVICLEVMRRVGLDDLTVSDRGLREGILCEILAASPP